MPQQGPTTRFCGVVGADGTTRYVQQVTTNKMKKEDIGNTLYRVRDVIKLLPLDVVDLRTGDIVTYEIVDKERNEVTIRGFTPPQAGYVVVLMETKEDERVPVKKVQTKTEAKNHFVINDHSLPKINRRELEQYEQVLFSVIGLETEKPEAWVHVIIPPMGIEQPPINNPVMQFGKGEIEFSKKGIMEVKSLLPGDQCVPHRVHGRPRGMDAYDIVDFYLDSDQDGVCAKIVNKL